jgi:tetratricopeptide (TPR) repeat protein
MTEHDRLGRPATAEPRSRLPIPRWMREWPRGVQPAAAWASRRGVELVFRVPAERGFSWFRVVASLSPGRPSGVAVQPLPGQAPEPSERLARAVEHHLARSGGAREWLARARAGVDSLASLQPISAWASLEQGEQALVRAQRVLGADMAELEVLLWLAAGSVERAFDAWARHAEVIGARREHRSLMCMAIVHACLGDVAAAQSCAIELLDRTRDSIDARHVGELLDWVGHPQLAVEQLWIAATDVGGDNGSFDAWRRLAVVAIAARQTDTLRLAATRMREKAQGLEQWREAASMLCEAGAFADAEATLEQLLREHPDDAECMLALARLRVWRGEHVGAAALARARLEQAPDDAAALRTLGVSEFLGGGLEAGLRHLTTALSLDDRDDEARLWRARVLDALGRHREARSELANVAMGDHVAWQLLRVLIPEHATPGYYAQRDTWFVVDQNIRQLLGDDAPPDTRASHEIAVASMEAALARLGGNYSPRPTTPTREGSLRWLDVESPRHRAEHLQLRVCCRPIDEVIAEFDALAAAHPEVPFFTTYAAELLLWRGEYEQALAQFERAWYATRTRWGYVGAGAAAMLLGRGDRALQLWDEGREHYTYLDAEATYCYRGELLLQRGEFAAAQADLELAVRARPARLGAWIDLALLHHAVGREDAMREAVARVEQLCPAFVWLVRRELGAAPGKRDVDVLERLRERMRGNRSSVMYTMIDDGGLRMIPVGQLDVWRDRARRALEWFDGELLSDFAGGEAQARR